MRLLSERQQSFAMGVNDSAAPDEYLPQQVQVLINGRPSLQGNTIETTRGQRLICSAVNHTGADASDCFGAIEFYTAAGVQQIVAAFDDAMYYSLDGGKSFTQITGATGLTEAYWSFAIIREGSANVLCCANGASNSYEYDGTTWSTIANIPANTKYLAVMGNRLWANDGTLTVSASAVSDIEEWSTGALSVVASTNDGDTEVTGLFQLGSAMLVFKRKSVGYIEGFGYQTLQVETGARGISRSIGCVAFRTIAPLGDHGVMWLSEQGFCAYVIGGAVRVASDHQRTFVDAISYDVIRRHPGLPSAAWWAKKQEYVCVLPVYVGVGTSISATRNNWMYCYRPGTESRPPAAYMRHDVLSSYSTLEIDENGELGILSLGSGGDLTGLLGKLTKQGELDVTSLPDPGHFMTTVNGELGPNHWAPTTGDPWPNSLFVADFEGDTGVLLAGTHSNRIVEVESATPDSEMVMWLRSRPMLAGDKFTRKKAKRATILATQPGSVTGTVNVRVDGVAGTTQSLAFTTTTGSGAQERRARVGGRGRVLQVEYRATGDHTVTGLELVAAPMGDEL